MEKPMEKGAQLGGYSRHIRIVALASAPCTQYGAPRHGVVMQ